MANKTRVAILGGGCGAMAAAFELTRPEHRHRYDVVVYQLGWRLGGKCASGREAGLADRVLEHGLHMLMGFYDDAFRVVRDCYAEWAPGRGRALASFDEAFERQHQITFQERQGDGSWAAWNVRPPVRDGTPGDPAPASPRDLLTSLLGWVVDRHRAIQLRRHPLGLVRAAARWGERLGALPGMAHALRALPGVPRPAHAERALDLARGARGARGLPRGLGRGSVGGRGGDREHLSPGRLLRILAHVERAAADARKLAASVPGELRHDALALRLGYAALRGYLADVLLHDGDFSRIDHLDFRAWLQSHGATAADAASAPVTALYDLGFAYRGGDATRPGNAQAAAGVALYVSLQIMFGCRGALLWKTKAGTGDTVFTPLYEVLRARGVRFEFFHRVDHLGLSPDRSAIDRVRITRQARLAGGVYDPLRSVPYAGGPDVVHAWPSEPLWDQLVDGAAIAERATRSGRTLESFWCDERAETYDLERGRDFDVVVFGLPLGCVPHVCQELVHARSAWRSLVTGTPTVQTQSIQLWMRPDLSALGFEAGPTVSISYEEPFDSWGDMSHLLPAERWPQPDEPRSLHYLCGAMPASEASPVDQPSTYPAAQLALAEASAQRFLASAMGPLWPRAVDGGALDRRLVRASYVRANADPADRYVLSVPGSIALRLPPDCSTFSNLFLAGDWVAGRVNSGCVEAAMSAGVHAARAIHAMTAPDDAAR